MLSRRLFSTVLFRPSFLHRLQSSSTLTPTEAAEPLQFKQLDEDFNFDELIEDVTSRTTDDVSILYFFFDFYNFYLL